MRFQQTTNRLSCVVTTVSRRLSGVRLVGLASPCNGYDESMVPDLKKMVD